MSEKIQFCKETKFKETEIGKIPIDWDVVKLQDVCRKIKAGGTPLTTIKEYWNGAIPFVKIEDITSSGKYLYRTNTTISEKGLSNSNAWLVPENSLLLAMYGSLGEVCINKIKVATNQAILGIVPKHEEDVEFLYYWFLYFKPHWKRYAKPTTQANLTAEIVRNIQIPFPANKKERITIANILSTIDESIRKTDEIISRLQELKKGLMHRLLTRGLTVGFMFDTNVFDRILDGRIELPKGLRYYVTHIQYDEILNIPESKRGRREELLKIFRKVPKDIIPTEGAFFGISRFNMAKYMSEEDAELCRKMLERLRELDEKAGKRKSPENQIRDVLIALTCLKNCLTLVTEDKNLKRVAQEFGCPAITLEQFLRGIWREYKDTEIGIIPEEWKVVKLKEVTTIIMGQSPPSSTYNKDGVGLVFLQGAKEFGEVYPRPEIYCSKPIKIAEKNDILISVRAPVGEVNISPFRCCIGRGLAAIRPNPLKLDFRFAFYYFKYAYKRLLPIGSGSTFKAIRKEDLEDFLIPLPSLFEQQKIAEILSTVDEEIQKERQMKEMLEKVKKWFMENLLTGKIRVK